MLTKIKIPRAATQQAGRMAGATYAAVAKAHGVSTKTIWLATKSLAGRCAWADRPESEREAAMAAWVAMRDRPEVTA
jgi:hypothetical protein